MSEVPKTNPVITSSGQKKADHLDVAQVNKDNVYSLIGNSKLIIRLLASGIALFFSFLHFRDLPVGDLINGITNDLIFKLSLIIYYFSWLFGTTLDASDQAIVFQKVPQKGKIPLTGLLIAVTIAILFGAVCATMIYKPGLFSLSLLLFWVSNYLFWKVFIVRLVKPFYVDNKELYNLYNNHYLTKRFLVVEQFLYGAWNKTRFLLGFIIVGFIVLVTPLNVFDFWLDGIDKQFCVAMMTLTFVLTMELWIWYHRLKRKFNLMLLTDLNDDENSSG